MACSNGKPVRPDVGADPHSPKVWPVPGERCLLTIAELTMFCRVFVMPPNLAV